MDQDSRGRVRVCEIAYFMSPITNPVPDTNTPPNSFYRTNPNLSLPIVDRDSPVNPSATMMGYFSATGNAIPDRFNLCRRVLLILPSLNDSLTGLLFSGGAGVSPEVRLQAAPIDGSNNYLSKIPLFAAINDAISRCGGRKRRSGLPQTSLLIP